MADRSAREINFMLKKIIDFLFKERESLKPLHRHFMQENLRVFNAPKHQPPAIKPARQPVRMSEYWTESGKTEWRHPNGGKLRAISGYTLPR
jgi:hypothetical protein